LSEEITIDETKKAVYSPYLEYMVIPSSSVYEHCSKAFRKKKLRIWEETEEKVQREPERERKV